MYIIVKKYFLSEIKDMLPNSWNSNYDEEIDEETNTAAAL